MQCFNICVKSDNKTYFDNFGIERIFKKNKKFLENKDIIRIICRIYRHDSMWGYFVQDLLTFC